MQAPVISDPSRVDVSLCFWRLGKTSLPAADSQEGKFSSSGGTITFERATCPTQSIDSDGKLIQKLNRHTNMKQHKKKRWPLPKIFKDD